MLQQQGHNNKHQKSRIYPLMQAILLSCMVLILSACEEQPFGPECIEADDWGQDENIVVRVDAREEMTYSGIRVASGEDININIGGVIDLCADGAKVIGPSENTTDRTPGYPPIEASIDAWQDSGLEVEEGSKLTILINGSYQDRLGRQTEGKGLYAYIGNEAPPNDDWWYGESDDKASADFRKTGPDNKNNHPRFFELWDNGTVGEGSGFSGIAPASGKIWFKYARTADARGMHNSGGNRYSPWKGHYGWENSDKCNSCRMATITSVCAAVSAATLAVGGAICLTSWMSSCASTGHLEFAANDWSLNGDGRHCVEHNQDGSDSDTSDHWIHDNYNGTESSKNGGARSYPDSNPNTGGYLITISKSCPGFLGKYLHMDLGESTHTLQDKLDANGQQIYNSLGTQKVKIPVHTLAQTYTTSMDLRCTENDGTTPVNGCDEAPYIGKGKYKAKVPGGGGSKELWFRLEDPVTTLDHPEPGYYLDNKGTYSVRVKTPKVDNSFSETLMRLVRPVKGVIFGHCKYADVKYTATQDECSNAWQPGITQALYNKLVGGDAVRDPETNELKMVGNPFIDGLRVALVLFIIIYGISFMMGMIDDKKEDFVKRATRLAIVSVLLSGTSWEFFSVHLFNMFIYGIDDLIRIISGEFSGIVSTYLVDPITGEALKDAEGKLIATDVTSNMFAFADMTISKFFRHETWIKLMGLIFASPLGIIYVILILTGVMYFVFSVIKAMILYIMAMFAISLLLVVAPIFISFMLFDKTRESFDQWIKSLINFTLQPVLVITILALFNVFIFSAMYQMLHYKVCWQTVFTLSSPHLVEDINLLRFYLPDGINNPDANTIKLTIDEDVDDESAVSEVIDAGEQALLNSSGIFTARGPGDNSHVPSMPMGLFLILIFIILCSAMAKFVGWVSVLASQITTGTRELSLNAAVESTINTAASGAKTVGDAAMKIGKKGAKSAKKAAAKRKGGNTSDK